MVLLEADRLSPVYKSKAEISVFLRGVILSMTECVRKNMAFALVFPYIRRSMVRKYFVALKTSLKTWCQVSSVLVMVRSTLALLFRLALFFCFFVVDSAPDGNFQTLCWSLIKFKSRAQPVLKRVTILRESILINIARHTGWRISPILLRRDKGFAFYWLKKGSPENVSRTM